MNILIADDHRIFRQGLLSLIKDANIGNVVADVDDGGKAWEFIQSHEPDVAILDITMGKFGGLNVCEKVRSHELKTRVVCLTMHNDVKIIDRAFESGAHGYLLKDEAFDSLAIAIATVIAGRHYVTPSCKAILNDYQSSKVDFQLTPREKEIIHHISFGLTNKQIGEVLYISAKTVDTHRTKIMKKLGFHKTADLVRFAVKEGITI